MTQTRTRVRFECIEQTVDFQRTLFIAGVAIRTEIRLWIDHGQTIPVPQPMEYPFLETGFGGVFQSWEELAEKLAEIPHINAFQVRRLDSIDAVGFVCYTVPFTDAHG